MKRTILSFIIIITFICTLLIPCQAAYASDIEQLSADSVSMYRLYNPNTGEHLYTSCTLEVSVLTPLGWQDDGIAWTAPGISDNPVYRLYNPSSGDHHYTMYAKEKEWLLSLGWQYEGIAWYSGGSVPVYRLFNPNAAQATHHYTASDTEKTWLTGIGWQDEGIAWYAMSVTGESVPAQEHIYHTWDNGNVTTEATCTTDGVMTYTCSCGAEYTEKIPATGHSYKIVSTIPAACTTGTTYTFECTNKNCGESYKEECDDALGHDITSTETLNATCTVEGVMTYECSRCDYSYTEAIPKKPHDYVGTVTAEATCETDGEETYTCSCGDSYTETIPALGHDWIEDTKTTWYAVLYCNTLKFPTAEDKEAYTQGTAIRCDEKIRLKVDDNYTDGKLKLLWSTHVQEAGHYEDPLCDTPCYRVGTDEFEITYLGTYTCSRPGCGAKK